MKVKNYFLITLLLSTVFTTGFAKILQSPQTVYRVYLKGESLGLISSKVELENYIDKKEIEIKEKYGVDKVYTPTDLDIIKEITYYDEVIPVNKIYNKIKDISPFTISGYQITIKGIDTQDMEGKTIKGQSQNIYVLDKKVFIDSIDNTVKAFIKEDDFDAFANKTQAEIIDTGTLIENIYIENKITIKKANVPVNETIYLDKETLSQYLLFGTTSPQQTYTVQAGDTIEDVAFNNKISTEEFLIANPNLTSSKSLLYSGQQVTLGILKPQINIIEEDHVVKNEEENYTTVTEEDPNQYTTYSQVKQAGVKGENRVTQKIQKVNGETIRIAKVASETIREPVQEIIVKGTKPVGYQGYGNVVPTRGEFGWPATCSTISSGFGWRWGTLHDGIDIAGCGYGSNIFAAQSGTVVVSAKKPGYYPGGYGDNGEYIIIDHHNGYYTIYAHMCPGCRVVSAGDEVQKGQVIGAMGMTGAASGPHLHFGIWYGYPYYGGRAYNAMNFY